MKKTIIALFILGTIHNIPLSAQEKWDLTRCIDYAIENNLSIKQGETTCKQNEVKVNTAKWSRLPNLTGSASHTFNFGRSLQANNTFKNINTQNTAFNLNSNIPLFTGMRITNTISLAKLDLKAAIEDLNKAKDDISIQVASAYLQVLFNEELMKVALAQVETSTELLTEKEAYFKNGKISESEWLEAKARLEQDKLSAVQANNNRQLALLDLTQLLELPTPEGFAIVSPTAEASSFVSPLEHPEDIYYRAIAFKPEIKAARYRLEGAKHNIRIAKSAYYPQLNLSGGISTNYFNHQDMNTSNFRTQLKDNFSQFVGFQLSVPIFNRLSTRNQTRQARIQQSSLSLQLEERKKTLFKEIQVAYYNAVGAQSRYESSNTAEASAEASFQLMKEKYVNGKATATDYNESRTNWMRALSEQIQAKYEYIFRSKILDFYKGIPLKL